MKHKSILVGMFVAFTYLTVSCTKHNDPVPTVTETKKVPAPPTIGTASASDASASVNFTNPSSDGGSAITGYTVTSNPGNLTATGTSNPIVISNLINGTSYTFTVKATNAIGSSIPSAPSNAVTPASPGMIALYANGSAWKFTKFESQPHPTDAWSLYTLNDCQKNEKLYFDLDLTYRTIASTGCTAAAPSGKWGLSSNDTIFTWQGHPCTITFLNATTFSITFEGTNVDGSKGLIRWTYTKE
jgi:hypothetical protein